MKWKFNDFTNLVFTIFVLAKVVECCATISNMERYGETIVQHVGSPPLLMTFFIYWMACCFVRERTRRNSLHSRCWWMFPRSIHRRDVMYQKMFRDDVIVHDMEWYADFCMTYPTFMKLCDVLRPYIEYKDTNYRPILSVEKVVALVLKKLAFGWSDRNVGNEFGVGRSTIFKYAKLVCKALGDRDKLYSNRT